MTAAPISVIGGRGRGGDGLLTILKTLAYAGLKKGAEVAYASNYNPETRGGMVEGSVILSAVPVLNPISENYTAVFAFDSASFDAYVPKLQEGGVLVWNRSVIKDRVAPATIQNVGVPVSELATRVGFPQIGNMIALGAFALASSLFTVDELLTGMRDYLPPWRQHLIDYNKMILEAVTTMNLAALCNGDLPEQFKGAG